MSELAKFRATRKRARKAAAAQESRGKRVETTVDHAPAAAPDIMDTKQDTYARKRGYRSIDELLHSRR